jgi:hypothetical protein
MDDFSNRRPEGQAEREGVRLRITDQFPDFRQRIADRCFDIFSEDLGKPTKISRSKGEARWNNHGSLCLIFAGPDAGQWFYHEPEIGGDTIDWIQQQHGLSFVEAVEHGLKERIQSPIVAQSKAKRQDTNFDTTVWARQQFEAAGDARGTLGERYSVEQRKIPREAFQITARDGFIRYAAEYKHTPFSKSGPALLFSATDLAGNFHGLQAVILKRDGQKLRKQSAGSLSSNHAIAWVSRGCGNILIVEGPEDALSVFAAQPDGMVGAALGSMKRVVGAVPTDRKIILVAQNDPKNSPAATAFHQACELLTASGHEVWIARPPEDIKDVNDLLKSEGIDAVRTMLDAAQPFLPPTGPKPGLPAYYPGPTEPADQALHRQKEAISDFIASEVRMCEARREVEQQVLAEVALNPDMTPAEKGKATRKAKKIVAAERGLDCIRKGDRLLITGNQGSGKTQTVLKALSELRLSWMRVTMTVPMLDKAEEALAAYSRLAGPHSLPGKVIRGRSAPVSKGSDERMCPRHEVVNKLAAAGVEIRKKICADCPLRVCSQTGRVGRC